MLTPNAILDGLITREGSTVKNDPNDPQDPSKFGIGAETLGNWRGLQRRATLEEVRALDVYEAREIYRIRYIEQPGFTPGNIPYEPLRIQLIDFGVHSGPERATKFLQNLLGITEDGIVGPQTRHALLRMLGRDGIRIESDGSTTFTDTRYGRWLNDALLARRLLLIDRTTDQRAGYKKYEEGLEDRALLFLAPALSGAADSDS